MVANTSLNTVNIDFDLLKNDFLTFLSGQDSFKDYDFTGSDLNQLIDLLTFNTQKNAFQINMGITEAFLDSAQKRNSILSRAKELNYLPRSIISTKANVTVSFTATGASQPYIIQKGQSFSAPVKNQNFIFTIPQTITVASANTSFSFTTDIYEGTYIKDSYIVNSSSSTNLQRYKIQNPNVDLSSLTVNVYENGSIIPDIYQQTTSLLGLTNLSKVYFIQTNAVDGNYEILFGDGVLGYAPTNGALVVLDYRLSQGPLSSGASAFSINFDPTIPSSPTGELTSNLTVKTNQTAKGGFDAEDIETTRFYAPRWFQTQERAVIDNDFDVLLKNQFPEISNIIAYGGDKLSPPQYGKAVVSLVISNVTGLPQSKIDQYTAFLQKRKVLTVFPIWLAAQFLYLSVNTLVRYNINVTTETDDRIKTLVANAISTYNTQNLNDFNVIFRNSPFERAIDNADPSIISNVTSVAMYQKFTPLNGVSQNMTFNFSLPLRNDFAPLSTKHDLNLEKTLWSSSFTFNGELVQLEDDGSGNIRIVKIDNNQYVFVSAVGTIDYDAGSVSLVNFKPDSIQGVEMKIYVQPRDPDIPSSQNVILKIDPSDVTITIQQVQL